MRSRAHLEANPYCVRCGDRATISDHIKPVRPDDREACCAGRSCRCAGRATAEFQAILDQSSAPWWDSRRALGQGKDRTAGVFADHHPGAAHALLGQAA